MILMVGSFLVAPQAAIAADQNEMQAQIEAVQQQVESLQSQLDVLKSQLIEQQNTDKEKDIKIAKLQEQIKPWYDKAM
ncbi:MAG: hypothetical protein COV73_03345, partial [Candidatus Omnitrophica bacterium CG11_big_fil_rev_8_21_14_0_20_43_6]